MTRCDGCRAQMKIVRVLVYLGDGDEEFDFEACTACNIVYISNLGWKIKEG
mgnify:CR=1 FL=1